MYKLAGMQVGYNVRFDDTSCPDTRIRYLTDGMLVREALVDPDLKRYKARSCSAPISALAAPCHPTPPTKSSILAALH